MNPSFNQLRPGRLLVALLSLTILFISTLAYANQPHSWPKEKSGNGFSYLAVNPDQ